MKQDVREFADLDALSHAAAQMIVERSRRAVADRGRFLIALSGGGTPSRLYHLLAKPPYRREISWADIHVFWGDERCVSPDDPQSNYRQAWDSFLKQVRVPPHNIHRVKAELAPQKAASDYALVLKEYSQAPLEWPRFDLVLLGMGEDGHTASLFPGSEVQASIPTLAVSGNYQGRPAWRVTLTPPVLNAAAAVIFLAAGAAKARTLEQVLLGKHRPRELPAQRIHPSDGELIWLVDRDAATGLQAVTKQEQRWNSR
jgi:6-phosphogluconolactonase